MDVDSVGNRRGEEGGVLDTHELAGRLNYGHDLTPTKEEKELGKMSRNMFCIWSFSKTGYPVVRHWPDIVTLTLVCRWQHY